MKLAPLPSLWSRSQIGRLREQGSPEHTTRSAAHTQAEAAGFPMNPFLAPVATISLPTPLDLTGPAPDDAEIPAGEWPASYTRGPEGAPLVERDAVYIWRR